MKNLKTRIEVLNETATLFGDMKTFMDKAKTWSYAAETSMERAQHLEGEVKDLDPSRHKRSNGTVADGYSYDLLRINGKFDENVKTPTQAIKSLADHMFGKDKAWTRSDIRKDGYTGVKGHMAITNPGIGTIAIELMTYNDSRHSAEDFLVRVFFMKDAEDFGIEKGLSDKIEELIKDMTMKDKQAIARHIQHHHLDFQHKI